MSTRLALAEKLLSWRLRLGRSRGASSVEYGLLCALIFIFILGSVASVGTEISRVLTELHTSMTAWAQT